MRRLIFIFCMLVNASVMLLPFNSTHAHVVHQHSAEVHGGHQHVPTAGHDDVAHGHSHDFDLDESSELTGASDEQIVELDPAIASQASSLFASWAHWLPLACVVVFIAFAAGDRLVILRPPESDPHPSSRHGYWRPPLRGPPLSIPSP